MVTAGPFTVDVARRLVLFNGQLVQLTPTEYDLLKVLITHRDNILSKQSLLAQIWGIDLGSDSHCLHIYITQLRRKIEVDPSRPHLIVNVPGVGYRLAREQEHSA